MPNDLLAGLDEIDFAELAGDRQAEHISWLIRALAETARTPAAAEFVSGLLNHELAKEHMAFSDATALAALFVARIAIHHPLPFVRDAARRLFEETELYDEDEDESFLPHQVRRWALKDASTAMREAEPDEDAASAIQLIAAVEGPTVRLHKQMRRLEARTKNLPTREAIDAVRQRAIRGGPGDAW